MAVLCSTGVIYIYSFNGSYLGVNLTSIVPSLIDLSFDTSGHLALVAQNGVFLLNNQTRSLKNSEVSLDSSCIINSRFLLIFSCFFICLNFLFRSEFYEYFQ